MSKLEEQLALHLRAEKIPFEREVSGLIPGRKFRVDFKIPPDICIEVQGGIYVKSGHTTAKGINRDCEKMILLQLAGYRVFPVTADHIKSLEALEWIKAALKN